MCRQLTVSVVIITYNQYDKLKEAITSVLRQRKQPDELIVLDDGSADQTVEYLTELEKMVPMLKWKSQKNMGVGPARVAATKMASCDIVAVLDSDDIFYPEAIFHYVNAFEECHQLDVVYGNIAVLAPNGKELRIKQYKSYKNNRSFKGHVFLNPQIPFKHSSVAFRRASYCEVGGYDKECNIKVDVDLMLKFITNDKKIGYIDAVVAGHRIHQRNLSRNRFKGIQQWISLAQKYESNIISRALYIIVRTVWELLKMNVEFSWPIYLRIVKFNTPTI